MRASAVFDCDALRSDALDSKLAACWSSERKRVERRHAYLSGRVTTEAIARSAHRSISRSWPVGVSAWRSCGCGRHGALLDEDVLAPDFVEQLSAAIHALNVVMKKCSMRNRCLELDIVAAQLTRCTTDSSLAGYSMASSLSWARSADHALMRASSSRREKGLVM